MARHLKEKLAALEWATDAPVLGTVAVTVTPAEEIASNCRLPACFVVPGESEAPDDLPPGLLLQTFSLVLVALVRQLGAGGWGPVLAGLAFAVHPVASVTTNNPDLFHHVVGLTLYLATFWCYLRGTADGASRHPRADANCPSR